MTNPCPKRDQTLTSARLPSADGRRTLPALMFGFWEKVRFQAFVVVVTACAWWLFFHTPEHRRPPGVLCAKPPEQGPVSAEPKAKWKMGGWTLYPLASYKFRARVLSTRRYRYDYTSPISPVDLAIGWNRMSDSAVLAKLDISQRGRWYNFAYDEEVIPRGEMTLSSANTHIIPADDAVRKTVLDVIRGDIVTLEGWLVEARPDKGGAPWRSSLSRADTEGGACELMFVEKASVE